MLLEKGVPGALLHDLDKDGLAVVPQGGSLPIDLGACPNQRSSRDRLTLGSFKIINGMKIAGHQES